MFGVAHENNPIALRSEFANFTMDLFYQRARGIDDNLQPLLFGLFPNGWRNAVRAKNKLRTGRNIVYGLNKMNALTSKRADHVQIMNDFVKNVEGRTMTPKRPFYGFDGHLHTRTEPSWFSQYYLFNCHVSQQSLEESAEGVNPIGYAGTLTAVITI
jgi:hypothetical protein